MKRPVSSLFAAAATGAVLLSALPASAQNYTNNFEATGNSGIITSETSTTTGTPTQAYTLATETAQPNYAKESGNTAGSNTNPLFLAEYSSGSSYGYTSNANYTELASTIPSTSGTAINGEGTFVNGQAASTTAYLNSSYNPTMNTYASNIKAYDGTQSELVSYVQNDSSPTAAGASTYGSFYRCQTVSVSTGLDALSRPTVDLGGTVSFEIYFDTGLGTGSSFTSPNTTSITGNKMGVEITCGQSSTGTALGAYGGTSQTNLFTYDATVAGSTTPSVGTNSAGPTSFPSGGLTVTSGSWQKVTFNLATDPGIQALGTTRSTSGFGLLNDIDFTNVGQSGQVYDIYIDDLTFTPAPAPEPSEWAGMGIGAMALLGLALRARRRNAGLTAA